MVTLSYNCYAQSAWYYKGTNKSIPDEAHASILNNLLTTLHTVTMPDLKTLVL